MEPIHYLRIFKRQWKLLAVLVVLGATAGWATTLLSATDADEGNYYVAVHTLRVNPDAATDLQQAEFLAERGEVPDRVAEDLRGDATGAVLSTRIEINPLPQFSTLEVVASGTDPRETELLSDAFAEELSSYMVELEQRRIDEDIQSLQSRRDELDAEYNSRCSGDVEGISRADCDSLLSRYEEVSSQLDELRVASVEEPFQTISSASAIAVGGEDFVDRLKAAADPITGEAEQQGEPTSEADQRIARELEAEDDGPGGLVRAGLGGFVGLLLGIGAVLVIDRIDPRLQTRQDAEESFGLPVVAELPPLPRRLQRREEITLVESPRSRTSEAYRVLRSSILFLRPESVGPEAPSTSGGVNGNGHAEEHEEAESEGQSRGRVDTQVIMITSPGPTEGKSTTAANLAAALAEADLSVLVLNCDFRRPAVHRFLGVDDQPRSVQDTLVPGVRLVTDVLDRSTEANPAEVVAAQRDAVRKARGLFDVIILDTAPLLTTNDATDLLDLADVVILVARAGRTNRESAYRAAELLERRGIQTSGVVLVGTHDIPTARYYYYSGRREAGRAGRRAGTRERSSRDTTEREDHAAPDREERTTRGLDPGQAPEHTPVSVVEDGDDNDQA